MSIKVSFTVCAWVLGAGLSPSAWAQSVANAAAAAAAATPAVTITATTMSAAADSASTVNLAQALRAARQNLDVSLAQRALAAAQADIRAADRAPTPVLSGKFSQMDLQHGVGAGNALTQKRIDKALGLDWTYERGNKRALRTQAAKASASAAQADVEDVQLQQLLATHAAYFDTLAAQERVEQVGAMAQSARQLANTAAQRVKVGDLAAQDASRTEIEAERAQADTVSARLDAQRAGLYLSQLMGQNMSAAAKDLNNGLKVASEWPSRHDSNGFIAINSEAKQLPLSSGELAALVEQRADVRAAADRVQAAQALADNAAALKRADITIGSSIDHFPGTSTRLLELRAQMPLQGFLGSYNYEGEVARALALLAQAQDALEKTRLMAQNEMQRQQQELLAAGARVQTYQSDIVPRARKVADLAELAFNRGAMSLTDLLDARRTLRATLLDAITARADHARALGAWTLRTAPQTLLGAAP